MPSYTYIELGADGGGGSSIASTDDLPEGAVNLYFTDERAQDAVGAALTDTATVNLTYNDGANTITADVIAAGVDHGSLSGLADDDHTQYFLVDGSRNLTGDITRTATSGTTFAIKRATGSSGVAAFTLDDAANGTYTFNNGVLTSTGAITRMRISHSGDLASFVSAEASEIKIQGNPITFTENGGSSVADFKIRLRNTGSDFNGRIALDDDVQLHVAASNQAIYSNRTEGATSTAFTFDTVNTFSTAGAKLWKLNNNTATKFAIAPNGGIEVRRTSTAASASSAGEVIIGVTSTAAARTITLDSDDVVNGRVMIIKDESGGAGTNNITIDTEGAETIDGAASIVISANYGVARIYSDGTNWFTF